MNGAFGAGNLDSGLFETSVLVFLATQSCREVDVPSDGRYVPLIRRRSDWGERGGAAGRVLVQRFT